MFGRLLRAGQRAAAGSALEETVNVKSVTDEQLLVWCRGLLDEAEAGPAGHARTLAKLDDIITYRAASNTVPLLPDIDALESVIHALLLHHSHTGITRHALSVISACVRSGWQAAVDLTLRTLGDSTDSLLAGLNAVPTTQYPSPADAFWCKLEALELLVALCEQCRPAVAVVRPLLRSNVVAALCGLLAQEEEEALRSKCLLVLHALAEATMATEGQGSAIEGGNLSVISNSSSTDFSPARQRLVRLELAMLLNYGNALPSVLAVAEHRGGVTLPGDPLAAEEDEHVLAGRAEDVKLCGEVLAMLLSGNPQALKYFVDADESLVPRLACFAPKRFVAGQFEQALQVSEVHDDWRQALACGLGVFVECLDLKAGAPASRPADQLISVVRSATCASYLSAMRLRAPRLLQAVEFVYRDRTADAHGSSGGREAATAADDHLALLIDGAYAAAASHAADIGVAAPAAVIIATSARIDQQCHRLRFPAAADATTDSDASVVVRLGTYYPTALANAMSADMEARDHDACVLALASTVHHCTMTIQHLQSGNGLASAATDDDDAAAAAHLPSIPKLLAVHGALRGVVKMLWSLLASANATTLSPAVVTAALEAALAGFSALTIFDVFSSSGVSALSRALALEAARPHACFHQHLAQMTAALLASYVLTVVALADLSRFIVTKFGAADSDQVRQRVERGGRRLVDLVQEACMPAALPAGMPGSPAPSSLSPCSAVRYTMRVLGVLIAAAAVVMSDGEDVRLEAEAERLDGWAGAIEAALVNHANLGAAAVCCSSSAIAAAVARESTTLRFSAPGGRAPPENLPVCSSAARQDSEALSIHRSELREVTRHAVSAAGEQGFEAAAALSAASSSQTFPTERRWADLAPAAWCRVRRVYEGITRHRGAAAAEPDGHDRRRSESPVRAEDLDRDATSQRVPLFVPPPPPRVARRLRAEGTDGEERDGADRGHPASSTSDPPAPHVMPSLLINEVGWPQLLFYPAPGTAVPSAAAHGKAAGAVDMTLFTSTSLSSFIKAVAARAMKAAREASAKRELAVAHVRIARIEQALLESQQMNVLYREERDAEREVVQRLQQDNEDLLEQLQEYMRREARLKRVCAAVDPVALLAAAASRRPRSLEHRSDSDSEDSRSSSAASEHGVESSPQLKHR
jgi:hypothetical protein